MLVCTSWECRNKLPHKIFQGMHKWFQFLNCFTKIITECFNSGIYIYVSTTLYVMWFWRKHSFYTIPKLLRICHILFDKMSVFISAFNHFAFVTLTLFFLTNGAWVSVGLCSSKLKWETATFASLGEYTELQSISETSLQNFWWSKFA